MSQCGKQTPTESRFTLKQKREFWNLMHRLRAVSWDAMREYYAANCCIAACSIMTRVLDIYGYRAEPIPVSAWIYNERAVKFLLSHESLNMPTDPVKLERYFDLTGIWGIAIIPESANLSR